MQLISDFADPRKELIDQEGDVNATGAWRRYAMHSAAEFLLRLIPYVREVLPIKPAAGGASSRAPRQATASGCAGLSREAQYVLETELRLRYSTPEAWHRLLSYAGLDTSLLVLSGSLRDITFRGLEAAQTQGKLHELLAVAARDYPDVAAFRSGGECP
jgi:hypothetical protein